MLKFNNSHNFAVLLTSFEESCQNYRTTEDNGSVPLATLEMSLSEKETKNSKQTNQRYLLLTSSKYYSSKFPISYFLSSTSISFCTCYTLLIFLKSISRFSFSIFLDCFNGNWTLYVLDLFWPLYSLSLPFVYYVSVYFTKGS